MKLIKWEKHNRINSRDIPTKLAANKYLSLAKQPKEKSFINKNENIKIHKKKDKIIIN